MKAPVSLGFLTPDEKRIRRGDWLMSASSGEVATDPETVPDWDYFTGLEVRRSLEVDLRGALEDCGLGPDSELSAVITWHSSWTNLRGASRPQRVVDGTNSLIMDLPGEQLGGTLTLQCRIFASDSGSSSNSLAPHRPGSTLWSDELRVRLEGAGERFPTLPVDFPHRGSPADRRMRPGR